MTYHTLHMSAFDALDVVCVSVVVRAYDGLSDAPAEVVLQLSSQVRGVGEADAREWTRDALVGLIEAL